MFLKNVWYAAWWIDELGEGAVQARTIAGQPLAFWRDEAGAPHAVFDRCPHRHAPLSLGKRVGNGLQCGYHGLEFNGAGACIANPHGPIVPALQVRAFPLVERHNLVWIWMGDAERADPDVIPDVGFADSVPRTAYSKGFLPTAAGHFLIVDNILDLTHADYLHAPNLGGGAMTRAKPRIEVRPDSTLFVEWLVDGDVIPPFFLDELPHPDRPVDIWNSVLWHPNGVMKLNFGATTAGDSRENGIDTLAAHIATPETLTSSHYFYFNTRSYRLEDAEYNAQYAEALRYAFGVQDKPMLEGQQRRLGEADLFDCKPVILPTDAASSQARRVYAKLLKAENAGVEPAEGRLAAAAS
jgi:phenylpropionate dioxygenase-like ring-hydroxylating dioxygenase large terminal subunit